MCPEVDTKQHEKARFFMKTSYFFGENNLKSFFRPGWKGMGDPGVEEVETRIFVKPGRGCGAVYLPCLRRFYALFLIIIQWITLCILPWHDRFLLYWKENVKKISR